MSTISEVMASWQALILAFAAFAVIGVVRNVGTTKGADGAVSGGFAHNKYFKMFLPLYPYLLTVGFVFIPDVPIPEKVGTAIGAKILFAVWCGWLSDKSFEVVKSVLEKGFGVSVHPSPGEK